jgi:hypothetical protein
MAEAARAISAEQFITNESLEPLAAEAFLACDAVVRPPKLFAIPKTRWHGAGSIACDANVAPGSNKGEPKAAKRFISDDDLYKAVEGRETEVLSALSIAWASKGHIRCPYPDHTDRNPSWRWDQRQARAHCTCMRGATIVRVVMKVESLDYLAAKLRIAEVIHCENLIRTTGEKDPLWFLHPRSDEKDEALPRDYLAYRLGLPPGDVLMPRTPTAGWRSMGYYEGDLKNHIGDYPCAVFGLVNADGRTHGQRLYLAPGGRGKAELPPRENGSRRDPKKAVRLPEGDRIDGRCVFWGDPAKTHRMILGEGIETSQALAQAYAADIRAGTTAVAAAISAPWLENWQPWPAMQEVIVIADRDEGSDPRDLHYRQGERSAHKLADKLVAEGLRVSVMVPGEPDTDCDALNIWERGGARAVVALVANAKTWGAMPKPTPKPTPKTEPWPAFIDILASESALPLFPTHLLPHPFGAFVADIADRMQVPPDFAAIPLLVEGATMLGRVFRLQPKRHDAKWRERACLWGMVIAPSGSRKTPAQDEALAPIRQMQSEHWRTHRDAVAAWGAFSKEEQRKSEKPVGSHILVTDATVEALAALMSPTHNADMRGILFYRDELLGWYRGMNQYKVSGAGSDRQFYLECYNGGPFGKYRVEEARTVAVEDAYLSICGSIQPGVLQETFRSGEVDGLLARFQLAVYPQPIASADVVDRQPDWGSADVVSARLQEMHNLPMLPNGGTVLRFDGEAYSIFMTWLARHQNRADLQDSTPLGAHFSKYSGTFVRLALVLHFMRHGKRAPVEIGIESAEAARDLINLYLEPHARRIYTSIEDDPDRLGAERIAQWIRATRRTDPIHVRDIRRNRWREFTKQEKPEERIRAIKSALDLLEAYGWVRAVETPPAVKGGRRTIEYIINPAALQS